ncbi:MAG TPA: hypothetical protein VF821_00015 [Lentzea sp.]
MTGFGIIPRHKRTPVPPLPPAPPDGFLGYVIVTTGDRAGLTHVTLLDRDQAEEELAFWKQRGERYAIAEVRVPP